MTNKKPKIEVTLLSKEEVEGKSKVLQKAGRSLRKGYWTSTRCSSPGGSALTSSMLIVLELLTSTM